MFNIPSHQEIQMKTTLRLHLTPVRMAEINKTGVRRAGNDSGKEEHLFFAARSENLTSTVKICVVV